MKSRYTIANYSLLIVFIGLLASYPFEETFWGGLFFSFCCAAFIGGIADWFAVTALFQKPLNISSQSFGFSTEIIRTNIIIKNRERMFTMLRDMVNKEILTKDQLRNRVHQLNSSQILLRIYTKKENQAYVEGILKEFILYVLHFFNKERILQLIQQIYQQNEAFSLAKLIRSSLIYCQSGGYITKGTSFLIKEGKRILMKEEALLLLEQMIEGAKFHYVNENEARRSVNAILIEGIMQLSSKELAISIQKYAIQQLEELESPNHLYRIRLEEKILRYITRLEEDAQLIKSVESWKEHQLKTYLESESFQRILSKGLSSSFTDEQFHGFIEGCIQFLKSRIQDFSDNEVMQHNLNKKLEKLLIIFLNTQHEKLDKLLTKKLNELSDQELVELIEDKAGNDLQMIRINGTIVGGIVGTIIYFVTFGWLG